MAPDNGVFGGFRRISKASLERVRCKPLPISIPCFLFFYFFETEVETDIYRRVIDV